MAKKSEIKGMTEVLTNLNREIQAIEGRTMSGLLASAAYIRTDMEKTPPLVPLDTGNLRASWFVTSIFQRGLMGVKIGFSALYALWVHEMVDKKVNWSRPGSGAKFLEYALKRNTNVILTIIRNYAKIK